MVDSRKSAQAKQQRRNRDGTYADEGKTSSMPTGDVLERFEQNQHRIPAARRLKPMRPV